MKNITIFVAILALVLGGVAVMKSGVAVELASSVTGTDNLGGQFEENNPKTFHRGITVRDGFTFGDGVVTVNPVSNAVTLTQDQLQSGYKVTFTASTTMPALTVTLPAVSTMTTLIPTIGDTRQWVIENPFLGAATTTTIAAGTGIDLQEPDGQDVVIGINNYAWLTCFRSTDSEVVCRVDESIPAD